MVKDELYVSIDFQVFLSLIRQGNVTPLITPACLAEELERYFSCTPAVSDRSHISVLAGGSCELVNSVHYLRESNQEASIPRQLLSHCRVANAPSHEGDGLFIGVCGSLSVFLDVPYDDVFVLDIELE